MNTKKLTVLVEFSGEYADMIRETAKRLNMPLRTYVRSTITQDIDRRNPRRPVSTSSSEPRRAGRPRKGPALDPYNLPSPVVSGSPGEPVPKVEDLGLTPEQIAEFDASMADGPEADPEWVRNWQNMAKP